MSDELVHTVANEGVPGRSRTAVWRAVLRKKESMDQTAAEFRWEGPISKTPGIFQGKKHFKDMYLAVW